MGYPHKMFYDHFNKLLAGLTVTRTNKTERLHWIQLSHNNKKLYQTNFAIGRAETVVVRRYHCHTRNEHHTPRKGAWDKTNGRATNNQSRGKWQWAVKLLENVAAKQKNETNYGNR